MTEIDIEHIHILNYEMLKDLGALDIKHNKKIIKEGYMDLNINVLQDDDKTRVIALASNYIKDDDVLAEPDMVIRIWKGLTVAEALTFQQDNLGVYKEVYTAEGKANKRLNEELNRFLYQWLQNLKNQGFY
jgi:uncharacterized protein YqiB (DUF1249 family)